MNLILDEFTPLERPSPWSSNPEKNVYGLFKTTYRTKSKKHVVSGTNFYILTPEEGGASLHIEGNEDFVQRFKSKALAVNWLKAFTTCVDDIAWLEKYKGARFTNRVKNDLKKSRAKARNKAMAKLRRQNQAYAEKKAPDTKINF